MKRWLASAAKYGLTTLAMPIERRRASRQERDRPLRLHLGSGSHRVEGWINIDFLRPARRLDLYWDLRRPLPYADGSADAVFAEHVLEHMSFDEGVRLLGEARRVLRQGGTVRVGVPDLDRYVASYLGRDDLIDRVRPGRLTRAIALGEIFFLHGHRCMYDFETMHAALERAGFVDIVKSQSGGGLVQPSADSPARSAETLYCEALAPAPKRLGGQTAMQDGGPG